MRTLYKSGKNQRAILAHLHTNGPKRLLALARELEMAPSVFLQRVASLQRRNLVTIDDDNAVALTKLGEEFTTMENTYRE